MASLFYLLDKVKNMTKRSTTAAEKKNGVTVKWLLRNPGLCEIYSTGLQYCFISKDNEQACPFVLCKDFLQDALMAWHNDKSVSIFGFHYSRKRRKPICMERTRIALANSKDPGFSKRIKRSMDFMHQIEKAMHLRRTRVNEVINPPKKYSNGVWIYNSSNRWMLAPPMISMYALLLRASFKHKIGDTYETTIEKLIDGKTKPYQRSDASQLRRAKPGIDKIIKYGYAKIFYRDAKRNYPDVTAGTIHGTGICAYSAGYARLVPYWYRDLNKKQRSGK